MAVNQTKYYLSGRDKTISMYNLDILDRLTDDDFTEYIISDNYKFRADKIALVYLGDRNLSFIILWINRITDWSELDSGQTIKLIKRTSIFKIYDALKIERNIK